MKQQFASVIIPVYNDIRFLKESIDSIFAQTVSSFEIILVDDGSDNSNEIARIANSYSSEKLRYVRNAKNLGLAASRNVGIRHSKGEFICFLDADDLFAPEKMRIQLAMFEADPSLLMVFSNEYLLSDNKLIGETNLVSENELPTDRVGILYCYARNSFIAVFTVMIRRSVIDKVGYFEESLRAWEDDDFWFRIMLVGAIKFSPYTSGYRRLHNSNMSSDRHSMNYFALKTFYRWTKLCDEEENKGLKSIIKIRAMNCFKAYLTKGIKARNFRLETLRLIFGIWLS